VHDGATIGTIIVSFIVSVPHTSLPAVPPAMRVVQVDPFGNTTFLTQSGSGLTAIGNGMYAFVLPSTAGAWYAMGGTQEISFVTSGAPVVSVAGYTYFVQIIDEAGAGAMIGNQYLCALAQMTGITSTRFQ
jgi:hypothetical protein